MIRGRGRRLLVQGVAVVVRGGERRPEASLPVDPDLHKDSEVLVARALVDHAHQHGLAGLRVCDVTSRGVLEEGRAPLRLAQVDELGVLLLAVCTELVDLLPEAPHAPGLRRRR